MWYNIYVKLAITQIVLGVTIVFFSFFIVGEVYMNKAYTTSDITPGFFTGLAVFATFILGLAVTGTGIAQLTRAVKERI